MIMTDPALIALQASVASFERSRPRARRFLFWGRRPTQPKFGTEAYYAIQRSTYADVDYSPASETGGPRVHATTRTSINGG